jgi:hypothetical protein
MNTKTTNAKAKAEASEKGKIANAANYVKEKAVNVLSVTDEGGEKRTSAWRTFLLGGLAGAAATIGVGAVMGRKSGDSHTTHEV